MKSKCECRKTAKMKGSECTVNVCYFQFCGIFCKNILRQKYYFVTVIILFDVVGM